MPEKLTYNIFRERSEKIHNSLYEYRDNSLKLGLEEFIRRSTNVHGNLYSYEKSIYTDYHTKIEIYCKKCKKYFLQSPQDHLRGSGCAKCKNSIGEKKISRILEKLNIRYISQFKFDKCKNINRLPFDFYLPDLNMCIEYDGKQHFESIECFGGEESLELTKKKDDIKNKFCNDNNIKLLRIKYDEKLSEKLKNNLIL